LRIANALWGEKTYPFREDYVRTIARYYGTGSVFPSDFKTQFPIERDRINDWVAEQTRDKITNIIPEFPPEKANWIRLILTNAIYFKGEWSVPFEEAETETRDFVTADHRTVQTPIMTAMSLAVGRYGAFNADGSVFDTPLRIRFDQNERLLREGLLYPDEDGFAVLELPYKGDDLSMVLIAPNRPDGLAAIEGNLDGDTLADWVGRLEKRKVHVFLPKFRMETEYELGSSLRTMGMVRAFTNPEDPEDGADFTGMSTSASPRDRLYITDVIHKAFVEVNERGTEAAAATAVGMVSLDGLPEWVLFTPIFKADRPFLFFIRDIESGSILFMGRVMQPES
jgi:serine protease inhibitor